MDGQAATTRINGGSGKTPQLSQDAINQAAERQHQNLGIEYDPIGLPVSQVPQAAQKILGTILKR
jgi:hypothetical protein